MAALAAFRMQETSVLTLKKQANCCHHLAIFREFSLDVVLVFHLENGQGNEDLLQSGMMDNC